MTTPNEHQNLLNENNQTHACGCGIGECKCGHHESCDCEPGNCKCGHGAGLSDDNDDAAGRTEGSCCGGHAGQEHVREAGDVHIIDEASTHADGTRWNDGHLPAEGGEATESGQGSRDAGNINE